MSKIGIIFIDESWVVSKHMIKELEDAFAKLQQSGQVIVIDHHDLPDQLKPRRSARMEMPDFDCIEKWLKTLEPMRPDYRAYERVKGSSGMKPKALNQSRPVGRPMRSVNRNR